MEVLVEKLKRPYTERAVDRPSTRSRCKLPFVAEKVDESVEVRSERRDIEVA
jgi:hypothetical protein